LTDVCDDGLLIFDELSVINLELGVCILTLIRELVWRI